MAESPIIEPCDLGFEEKQEGSKPIEDESSQTILEGVKEFSFSGLTIKEARRQVDHALLQQVLERTQGNIQKTAEELDVSRPTLYDLLKKHGLHQA